MSDFAFKTPATVAELTQCLAESGPDTYLLGGGTDLVIRLRDRGIHRGTLVDLAGVAGLDAVVVEDDVLRIGANVTYAAIAEHPELRALVPCLADMALHVGSAQIRNMARIPGNLANASPAGDTIGTLMALDASVLLLDGQGRRTTRKVEDLVVGIGKTTLEPGQAILEVRIPRPGPGVRSRYGKIGLGARREVVIANVSLTLVVDYPQDRGRIRDARVVLGSAAPRAYHATAAEALLRGRRPEPELGRELAEALRAHVEESIKGVPIFMHKMNDVQGLAVDLFTDMFADVL